MAAADKARNPVEGDTFVVVVVVVKNHQTAPAVVVADTFPAVEGASSVAAEVAQVAVGIAEASDNSPAEVVAVQKEVREVVADLRHSYYRPEEVAVEAEVVAGSLGYRLLLPGFADLDCLTWVYITDLM